MKSIPPVCPEPDNGVQYWRSLDALEGTPEARAWVEREFKDGASELTDPFTRRDFMRLMSAGFALAGVGALTGCRRPVEKIYPFGKQPENYIHGVPQFYATAMPTRHGAVPLVVKSHEGRPIKVEGNREHPFNTVAGRAHGGTDLFAQASLLDLYDPDRAQRFTKGGNRIEREAALDQLSRFGTQFTASRGAGVAVLMESSSSPSRDRLVKSLAMKWPEAKWFTHDAIDLGVGAKAASLAFGRSVQPHYKLENAKVILSLDSDFIATEEDSARLIRGFAQGRKISESGTGKQSASMSRLYAVESLLTQTGANADHRLRVPAGQVIAVAAAIAAAVEPGMPAFATLAQKCPLPASVKPEWIRECARDLVANKGKALVLAGHRQPLAVHLVAHLLNTLLDAIGSAVVFYQAPARHWPIEDLANQLGSGGVSLLVILGGNPVFTAPAQLNFAAALKNAKAIVRLGTHEDETFAALGANGWQVPAAHYLESWGDARTSDGTLVAVQPLIEPLYAGLTETEVLARLGASELLKSHDIARDTFLAHFVDLWDEDRWKRYLHDGFLAGYAQPLTRTLSVANARIAAELAKVTAPAAVSAASIEVVLFRDTKLDDGRFANNAWMQELPDPITKIVWDNALLISRKTAVELGLNTDDVVEIAVGGRKLSAPVWVQPGQADYSVGLALGWGRDKGGRIANFNGSDANSSRGRTGFNGYALRTDSLILSGAKLTKTGATYKLVTTQDHWSMEGRPVVREANLKDFNEHPDFARNMDLDAPSHSAHIPKDAKGQPLTIYKHPYTSHGHLKSAVHQWGMSIDLNSCVGCNACVIACQSENNIPIVGKDQVHRNREMHWMRIDRYFTGTPLKQKAASLLGSFANNLGGTPGKTDEVNLVLADTAQPKKEWIDEPQMVNQPMLCQHCEAAPCESVCPVNATVHDEEGINVMAYNRCVGTRYCSNNCAWKVRRFNFFDFNKRPLEALYKGPLAKRGQDELDLVKLAKNPEVSIRMRGVMEKCTFCVQRVQAAKISQKVKAGASGDVEVRDGVIQTACEQACPADAIVFGNLLDPQSRVSKIKKQQRDYTVLGFLDTRPRLTYLARIRNPNPAMPDYKDHPLPHSLDEYSARSGSPLEAHGPAAGGAKKGAH
jgi:molybdopterin-containing oxidoreductase family iron-sulfur binding subunit